MKNALTFLVLTTTALIFSAPALADSNSGILSLDQLRNIEVTSVSKTPENSFNSPAAISVITSEDIRRSGATSVAEALRLVPGLQVARVNSNTWAITSRGFTGQFANKLLVMIDGRTVYTPLFSGVYWDVQDMMLEDIKRIEVIRGPGATLWGANAVNGVINIITKSASETQGALASGLYGTKYIGYQASTRYGGKVGDDTYYRVYAKRTDQEQTELLSGLKAHDGWDVWRTGFRVDWEDKDRNNITVQGDAYNQGKAMRVIPISLTPQTMYHQDSADGGNAILRWSHKNDNSSESVVQFYVDRTLRDDILLEQKLETIDFDYQNTWNFNDRNELVSGAGFRKYWSDLVSTPYYNFNPSNTTNNLYSSFVQDKYSIIPKKLFLTLGTKVEHYDFTGVELEPSVRLSWLPTDSQTVWASVSKAARTPSIGEENISLIASTFPRTQGLVINKGNTNQEAENLIAYELGYRIWPRSNLSFDATTFYNDYKNLVTNGTPSLSGRNLILPINNLGKAQTYGLELASTWDVTEKWRLIGSYTLLRMNIDADSTTKLATGKSPQNQFQIRSHYNFPHNIEFDNMLYYVEDLPALSIDGYTRFDSRLSWKATNAVELSLVGQNLFDNRHQEFSAPLNLSASDIGRVVYAKVTVQF